MDTNKIREVVRELMRQPAERRGSWCRANRPEFADAFPTLLRACIERPDDLRFLEMMLKQRDALASGASSVDDADRHVYDTLREHYICPLLPDRKDCNAHPAHSGK